MDNNVKIVSDGTGFGTRVLVDGIAIQGVTKVEIGDIQANSITTAKITVEYADLDINVESENLEIAHD